MKNFQIKTLIVAALALTTLFGCDKGGQVVDTDTPAYHIAQSEQISVPDEVRLPLNAPKGNKRVLTVYAIGVQKYKAVAKAGEPGVFDWAFVAPQADLYDAHNNKIGTHSAGPTWQLSASDSIYAQAFTPAKAAPSPDGNSIDWLLLMPKAGKIPTGIFTDVQYIQRLDTKGGKAPATRPTSLEATIEVPYTAVYRFSKPNQ